jgi:uncharacterized membrane protein YhaH (DUF805 family)
MPRVTLSYRRDDSAAIARLVFEHLRSRYGLDNVFVDIDSIEFGEDYRERIHHALGRTDYLLVLIGSKWLGPMGKGRFRIQEVNDPVRIEVERALEIGIRVVPILIEHTPMPTPADLPESLERLAYLNAAEVSVGRDFDSQMDRLTRFIDRTYQEVTERHDREIQERPDLERAQIEPTPAAAPAAAEAVLDKPAEPKVTVAHPVVPEPVATAKSEPAMKAQDAPTTVTASVAPSPVVRAQQSVNWYALAFRRYFNFKGRSRRREYWWFTLINTGIMGMLALLFAITQSAASSESSEPAAAVFWMVVLWLFIIAVTVPSIAVGVRRLHDTNRSGWWVVLGLIPYVNFVSGIVLLVFYCIDSDPGTNQYGPNPKEIEATATSSARA